MMDVLSVNTYENTSQEIVVEFRLSLRQLVSQHHNAHVQHLLTVAAQQMERHVTGYLNSREFYDELRTTCKTEMKRLMLKKLEDRIDEFVTEMTEDF